MQLQLCYRAGGGGKSGEIMCTTPKCLTHTHRKINCICGATQDTMRTVCLCEYTQCGRMLSPSHFIQCVDIIFRNYSVDLICHAMPACRECVCSQNGSNLHSLHAKMHFLYTLHTHCIEGCVRWPWPCDFALGQTALNVRRAHDPILHMSA